MEGFKVKGIDEINARMDRLGRNLKQRSGRRIIKKALEPMFQSATARTPVWTGRLQRGWKIKTSFNEKGEAIGWLTNTFFTAYWLERGHKIVRIERRGTFNLRKRRWSGGRVKHVVGYAPGKNFLRSAFETTAEQCIDVAAAELKKSLDGALAGGK